MVEGSLLLLKKTNFCVLAIACTPHNLEKKALNGLNVPSFLFFSFLAVSLVRSSNQTQVGTFSYFQLYLLAFILSICYTIFNKI